MKRKVRFEGHLKGQGHHKLIVSSRYFQKCFDDWTQEQILYQGYHIAVINDLMSKLQAFGFFGDLKSKVKVIKEVKVLQENEKCGKLAGT